ncbi:hypothetical protein ACFVTJ_05045 [Agrobacterium sp. NPDC058088]|uniref:hypothetical protein n=1 Tax=Agrobacterium sp. NPDC058088 TaxID=3346335 RepID=UPI0036DA35C5
MIQIKKAKLSQPGKTGRGFMKRIANNKNAGPCRSGFGQRLNPSIRAAKPLDFHRDFALILISSLEMICLGV